VYDYFSQKSLSYVFDINRYPQCDKMNEEVAKELKITLASIPENMQGTVIVHIRLMD
jgi:hypothetical protein